MENSHRVNLWIWYQDDKGCPDLLSEMWRNCWMDGLDNSCLAENSPGRSLLPMQQLATPWIFSTPQACTSSHRLQNWPFHCSTSLSATICRTAEHFFFRNTTPCNKPIEQPVSNKIASLLGKLLNICVDRLCLKFSKIRIGDREKLARKTDRALGELGLTAEKRAKPCRGRAATRTPSSTRERTAEKRKELCRSSKSTSTRNWTPIWPRTPRQEKYGSFVPRYEIEIALGSN